jgi:hypothetical protein
LPRWTAVKTSSMPICRYESAVGSSWMRTARFCEPKTSTWETPLTIEIRCARTFSAYSSTSESDRVSEKTASCSTGASAGLVLR